MAGFIAAVKIAAPYIAAGSSVMSAFGSIQAGKSQSEMYKLQAEQARLKALRDQLQYEQQANMVFEKMLMTNANAAARGFAGGVQGFSGSSKLIQGRNEKVAGRDIQVLQEGSKMAKSFGEVQAAMMESAADQAIRGSYFDAIGKIGSAAYMYSMTAPGGSSLTPNYGQSNVGTYYA